MYSSSELVASNFAKNHENFKGGLCLNVITPFTIIVVVLQLRDIPKTVIWIKQNGGTAPRSDSTALNYVYIANISAKQSDI